MELSIGAAFCMLFNGSGISDVDVWCIHGYD